MLKGGTPGVPGAELGPSSKTSRSNPGLCAIRIAVSCAWLPAVPPVTRGQAAAGLEPGLAAADPVGCDEGVALGVGRGLAVGALVRAAVAGALGDAAGCGAQALATTIATTATPAKERTSRLFTRGQA